jgi:hypothetical protein
MSVARSMGQNGGHFYSNITQPVEIDLNFVVDATNGNGLGVRSIKSNGYVQNVFMHTSATPGRGLGNYLNPNPASGYALIQFKNNFNVYLGGFSGFASQLSGSNVSISSGLTAGNPYVIVSVGTSTQANWQAVGLPPGLTPTVGQSFICTSSSPGTGTGIVQAPAADGSGIMALDVIGDPNQSISNSSIAQNGGAWVLVRFLASATSGATAPANNSVCGMTFKFDRSSVSIPDGGPSNSGGGGL